MKFFVYPSNWLSWKLFFGHFLFLFVFWEHSFKMCAEKRHRNSCVLLNWRCDKFKITLMQEFWHRKVLLIQPPQLPQNMTMVVVSVLKGMVTQQWLWYMSDALNFLRFCLNLFLAKNNLYRFFPWPMNIYLLVAKGTPMI